MWDMSDAYEGATKTHVVRMRQRMDTKSSRTRVFFIARLERGTTWSWKGTKTITNHGYGYHVSSRHGMILQVFPMWISEEDPNQKSNPFSFFSFESFRAPAIDAWPFSHGSETCIRIVTLAYYNPYQWAVQSPIFSKFRPFPAQNSPFASEVQRGWHQKFRQLVKQPLSKGFLARSYTKASWSKSSLYSSSSRSSTGTLSPMLVLLAT